MVDRAVAGEAIQPGPQLVGTVAAAQRLVRADEDVLHDVLRVVLGASQQRAGVAGQGAAVTTVERRKRSGVTAAHAEGEFGVICVGAGEEGGHDADYCRMDPQLIEDRRPAAGWIALARRRARMAPGERRKVFAVLVSR